MEKKLIALAVVLFTNVSFAQMKKNVDHSVENPTKIFYCKNGEIGSFKLVNYGNLINNTNTEFVEKSEFQKKEVPISSVKLTKIEDSYFYKNYEYTVTLENSEFGTLSIVQKKKQQCGRAGCFGDSNMTSAEMTVGEKTYEFECSN